MKTNSWSVSNISSGISILSVTLLWCPKIIKTKKVPEVPFQQCRSIKFKKFWPISPHHGWGAACDTKTSDFRYKQYPPTISGYVTFKCNNSW